MKAKLLKSFNIAAGCASILSVTFLLLTDQISGMIALCAFCLFLICLLALVTTTFFRLVSQENPEEYKKIAAFTSYEAVDDAHGIFEVFKVIQSKRFILQRVEHNFKWTGTKRPVITSELQEIERLVVSDNKDYDKALLRSKKPIESNAPLDYEQYGSIPFDIQSKSYQYCLTDPEIGYFYRVEWEK